MLLGPRVAFHSGPHAGEKKKKKDRISLPGLPTQARLGGLHNRQLFFFFPQNSGG